ncbi:hypothetical protein CR513_03277, partial [Mucuna pruriens]
MELCHCALLDDLVHQAKEGPNLKEEGLRKDINPKKGSSIPKGSKKERALPCPIFSSKSNNIKCFKCLGKRHIASQSPNKKSMIISITQSLSKSNSKASYEYSLDREGNSLLVGEDDDKGRENIFHSLCHVIGQLCSIIIDGGSNVNIASLRLVSLAFTLGKYGDEVLYDVVPMKATHILLGRP